MEPTEAYRVPWILPLQQNTPPPTRAGERLAPSNGRQSLAQQVQQSALHAIPSTVSWAAILQARVQALVEQQQKELARENPAQEPTAERLAPPAQEEQEQHEEPDVDGVFDFCTNAADETELDQRFRALLSREQEEQGNGLEPQQEKLSVPATAQGETMEPTQVEPANVK